MIIESSELVGEWVDEERGPYILKFVMPQRQNDIPHLRVKTCKMLHLFLGVFTFISPLFDHRKVRCKFKDVIHILKVKEKVVNLVVLCHDVKLNACWETTR